MWTELLLALLIVARLNGAIQQKEREKQQIEQQQIEQQNKEQKIEQQRIEEHNKALAESMRSGEDLRNEILDMERWLVDTQKPIDDLKDQAYAALANDPFSPETQALMQKQADWKELQDSVRVEITKLKKLLGKYENTNNKPTDDNIITIDSVGKG